MKPTYQSILRELILCDLDEPPYIMEAHDWCRSHGLIESRLLDETLDPTDARSYRIALTTTGQNLLNQTSIYFRTMINRLHETGQINVSKKEDTDHDTQQQGHDGSKGKAKRPRKAKALRG
jgi:hypothetical protein